MAGTGPLPSEATILTERAKLMQSKAGSSAFMPGSKMSMT